MAGSFLAPRGAGASGASGTAAPASRPWRSVSAPATTLSLLDYLTQPPGAPDAGTGDAGDTTDTEPPIPPSPPPPTTTNPNFLPQDTAHVPSLRAFPGRDSAAVETIGPPAQFRPAAPKTGTPAPAVHAHRGIWGMQPLVLLAGLIALHILIVSTVTK